MRTTAVFVEEKQYLFLLAPHLVQGSVVKAIKQLMCSLTCLNLYLSDDYICDESKGLKQEILNQNSCILSTELNATWELPYQCRL